MAGKKIKLGEKAISEILLADTDWESGAGASNVEDCFKEEEEEEAEEEDDDDDDDNNNNNKPQQKSNHRMQHLGDYQPGDHLKEVRQIFILCRSSKRCEKEWPPHINKHS